MKVVLRISTVLDFGGIERRLVNTATATGNDLTFVFLALGKGGWAEREIRSLGSTVIVMNHSYKIPNFLLIVKLWRLIKKLGPDVVHTSGAEANFHGVIAARLCAIPIVVAEEVGFPSHGRLARTVFKLVYSMSDRVIAISDAVRKKLMALGEVKYSKCVVIYNPVAIPQPVLRKGLSPVIRLLMVSRLEPIKNIESVLRFLSTYRRTQQVQLTIVGDGSLRPDLEQQIQDWNLSDVVKIIGFQSDTSSFYQNSDVFLLPSFSEGLSNSLLEAMSYGLICIATRIGGPAEIITEGETGFLIDPYSDKDIAHALTEVLEMNDERRGQMFEKTREALINRFSAVQYVANLKDAYE